MSPNIWSCMEFPFVNIKNLAQFASYYLLHLGESGIDMCMCCVESSDRFAPGQCTAEGCLGQGQCLQYPGSVGTGNGLSQKCGP